MTNGMTSRLVDHVVLVAAVAIFCAAVVVLCFEFASVSPHDVLAFLAALSKGQVFAAIGLTAASYLLLTGYDFLALRYVRRRLRFREVLLASFTAFAFSNNIGFQFLSGGSMRYRIYSSFGLNVVEVGEIVAFCTFAYALGVITVGGLLALFEPAEIASLLNFPPPVISAVGFALLAPSAAYLAVAAIWHKPIAFRRYRLRPPSLLLAASQVALASIDAVLAGTVMYVLLPADLDLSYQSYLGIYLIAATMSVLSLVPGGLGVFEAAVTLMTMPPSKAAALSAFFAYRLIYFIFPLVIAIVFFALHEIRRMPVRNAFGYSSENSRVEPDAPWNPKNSQSSRPQRDLFC
jgi:phosphatidylglycerol lysyltransferase